MANDWRVPGFTSTGSKRPEALFGAGETGAHLPRRMTRSAGCRVWDADGREYLDYVMALGAVALGYGHPEVTGRAAAALAEGAVGPLPPVLEEELAEALARGAEARAWKPPRRTAPPAEAAELERLFADVEAALRAVDFFKHRSVEAVMRTVREVIHRAPLDQREAKLFRAMAIEVVKHGERLARTRVHVDRE